MSDADERAAKRLLQEIEGVKEQSQFLAHQPLWYQRDWITCREKFVLLTTGNRLGKSTTGAFKTIIEATGVVPPSISGVAPPRGFPIGTQKGKRILVAGETMKVSVRDTILPKLREFIVPAMLVPGPKAMKRNPQTGLEEIFRFRSGCELVIGSYDQPVKSYEGTRWDFVWLDEPPGDEFLRAIVRGTIDHSAQILLSATPLNCGYLWDEYIEPSQDSEHPLHGMVARFTADMHWNCRECYGGFLPHKEIVAYLSTLPPEQRAARERGEFANMANVEFSEFSDNLHVVPDLWGPGASTTERPDPQKPETWPSVCIVDPSLVRGLHVVWATVSPKDCWFVTAAAQIPLGGISEMTEQMKRLEAERLPRPPSFRIMDCRGGAATVDINARDDFFRAFARLGLLFVGSKSEDLRQSALHDWLKPAWNPVTERMEAKFYFTRSVAQMKKGPVWGLKRYVWNPEDTLKKRTTQPGKDWVDCLRYLVLQPGMSWRNLAELATDQSNRPDTTQTPRGWSMAGSLRPRTGPLGVAGHGAHAIGLPRQSLRSRTGRSELW